MSKNSPTSIRLDETLKPRINEWLGKNDIGLSKLVNLAVAKFISEPQTLEPVELVSATDDEVEKAAKKMIKKHKKALDRLK